jgi:hypothetical protein
MRPIGYGPLSMRAYNGHYWAGLFWLVSSGVITTGVLSTHCVGSRQRDVPRSRFVFSGSVEARRQASNLIRPTHFFAGFTNTRMVVCASARGESSIDQGEKPCRSHDETLQGLHLARFGITIQESNPPISSKVALSCR